MLWAFLFAKIFEAMGVQRSDTIRLAQLNPFSQYNRGDICSLFPAKECWNFFKAQNYVAD